MNVEIDDVVRRVRRWAAATYMIPPVIKKDILRLCNAAEEKPYGEKKKCCGGSREEVQEKPRKRFEYKSFVAVFDIELTEEEVLNQYGAEGWELVSAVPYDDSDGDGDKNCATLMFKREVL
jgi:hypothetical protein